MNIYKLPIMTTNSLNFKHFLYSGHLKKSVCLKCVSLHKITNSFQTTKDRYMWSCDYRKKAVGITIHLSDKDIDLSRIKIWNYNKALSVSKSFECRFPVLNLTGRQ